jgi:hypothetical protein
MKAASQVPSGVLISTLSSTTVKVAADAEPVAATRPAADNATKSRRDRPPRDLPFRLGAFSFFFMVFLSFLLTEARSPFTAGIGGTAAVIAIMLSPLKVRLRRSPGADKEMRDGFAQHPGAAAAARPDCCGRPVITRPCRVLMTSNRSLKSLPIAAGDSLART